MIYYIDTIEQVKGENDTVNEYGGRAKEGSDLNAVLSKYFKKLSDVSADIGKNHYYMDIRIVDTTGGVSKRIALVRCRKYELQDSTIHPHTMADYVCGDDTNNLTCFPTC